MELEEALNIVNECMSKLERIPWPELGDPDETPFYPPADEHLLLAYQELDEAHGQLSNAVKYQNEHLRGPTRSGESDRRKSNEKADPNLVCFSTRRL